MNCIIVGEIRTRYNTIKATPCNTSTTKYGCVVDEYTINYTAINSIRPKTTTFISVIISKSRTSYSTISISPTNTSTTMRTSVESNNIVNEITINYITIKTIPANTTTPLNSSIFNESTINYITIKTPP